MGRSVGVLAWLVAALVAFAPRGATACSCMLNGPACQAYWKTTAVFDATVLSITPLDPAEQRPGLTLARGDKIVKLDVRQSWKGVAPGPLEIMTGPEGGGCGYPFREGGRYLVFAFGNAYSNRLQASICSLTQEFNGSGDAAAFLASLNTPARDGGRVFGTVRTSVRVFDPERPRFEAATETPVRLSGGGQERATTSSGGRYEFTGLPEGPYRIEAQIPDGYTTYSVSREVLLADRRGCAEENFSFSPAGRIAGRLVGPDGRGIPRLRVEVVSADARPHPRYGLTTASGMTDTEGYFEISDLPPGRYLAAVNLKDLPNQYNPYPRTVYPGGTSEPHALTLSLGQIVDLGSWAMPPPLAAVRISGVVTWRDGSPAVGVYVGARDRAGNPIDTLRGAGSTTSGEDGRFVLELRQGRVYDFTVRDPASKRLVVSGPPLEIGARAREPVRIVIPREPPRKQP
jgi:hypothetical protein